MRVIGEAREGGDQAEKRGAKQDQREADRVAPAVLMVQDFPSGKAG
jgi:hypothetical protein